MNKILTTCVCDTTANRAFDVILKTCNCKNGFLKKNNDCTCDEADGRIISGD